MSLNRSTKTYTVKLGYIKLGFTNTWCISKCYQGPNLTPFTSMLNKLRYIKLYISKTRIYRSFSEVPLPFKSMLIKFIYQTVRNVYLSILNIYIYIYLNIEHKCIYLLILFMFVPDKVRHWTCTPESGPLIGSPVRTIRPVLERQSCRRVS